MLDLLPTFLGESYEQYHKLPAFSGANYTKYKFSLVHCTNEEIIFMSMSVLQNNSVLSWMQGQGIYALAFHTSQMQHYGSCLGFEERDIQILGRSVKENRLVQTSDRMIELVPKTPAEVFGEYVISPLLDKVGKHLAGPILKRGGQILGGIKQAFVSVDLIASKFFKFPFVVAATPINKQTSREFGQIEINSRAEQIFINDVEQNENLMEMKWMLSPYEYAYLSLHAYQDNVKEGDPIVIEGQSQLNDWNVLSLLKDTRKGMIRSFFEKVGLPYGYKGTLYISEKKKQIVLAHRGTELTNLIENPGEALSYHKKALEMRKRLFPGKGHFDLANSFNNVGVSLGELGNPSPTFASFR